MAAPTTLPFRPARLPVRIINWLMRPFKKRLIPITVASLRAFCERKTGLKNWGDPTFWSRLQHVVDSVDGDDNVAFCGRIAARTYLRWHLRNRLELEAVLAEHPEILEIPVERPMFIVGWWRTGTTFLHHLMSMDPKARAPKTWELWYPAPVSEDPKKDAKIRRKRTSTLLWWNKKLIPDQAAAHNIETDSVEECFPLMENDGIFMTFFFAFLGYDYSDWILKQDLTSSFEYIKKQYQVLAWKQPNVRWVLKCPYYLWHMDALLNVFPDACIVHTHRNVVKSLPSACNLSAITASKFLEKLDLSEMGRFWRDMYRSGSDRSMAVRRRIPPGSIYDVPLRAFVSNPTGTIKQICRYFGFHFSEEFGLAMRRFGVQNPNDKHGVHQYTLEHFGLDEDDLRQRFDDVAYLWEIDGKSPSPDTDDRITRIAS